MNQPGASQGVRCVWVSRNRQTLQQLRQTGFEAVHPASVRGLWLAVRAGAYFVNCDAGDVGFLLSKGAVFVNLWHGIPLKKIGYDDERRAKQRPAPLGSARLRLDRWLNPRKAFRYDRVLSTSDYVTRYSFASAFDVLEADCLALGYPRTDILLASEAEAAAHVQRFEPALSALLEEIGAARVFLYAPTWRDSGEDFVVAAGLDFADLNRRLVQQDAYLLLKMHPYTKLDLSSLNGLDRIRVLPRDMDLYPLMRHVDVLITDYSSIYFDYLLLNRPVVFFCFDLAHYLNDCRSFYLEYDQVTPGIKAHNYAELCGALFEGVPDRYQEERAAVRAAFWGEYKGQASAALACQVSSLLSDARKNR